MTPLSAQPCARNVERTRPSVWMVMALCALLPLPFRYAMQGRLYSQALVFPTLSWLLAINMPARRS